MHQIDIKALSVNQAWQGKRFSTKAYKKYRADVMILLPKLEVPEGELFVRYEFGLSNAGADWDNPIKPFQDILQKKYGFNDSKIMRAVVDKIHVKKGHEYIKFRIGPYKAESRELENEDN